MPKYSNSWSRVQSMASSSLRALSLTNFAHLVADQAFGVTEGDRLAERGDALAAYLLGHVAGQQPGRQPGVLRLLAGHLGRGLDRQPVQLGGGGPVVQAADRLGRDPQRVDLAQAAGAALHGPDDLAHVDRLPVTVALADVHPRRVRRRIRACVSNGHGSLLASSWPDAARLLRAARRQVFGLAGPASGRAMDPARGRLLAVASQADATQCLMTAVVPAHRCGAVPDSHRVPCCLRDSG